MDKIDGFNRITEAIISFRDINESWRFTAFMIIMAAGISLFEILFLFIKTRFNDRNPKFLTHAGMRKIAFGS
jgi:hypothetical protein